VVFGPIASGRHRADAVAVERRWSGGTAATGAWHSVAEMSDADDLFEAAMAVRQRAHCPYSEFQVGAAIRTTAGDVFVGCNVENASYPEGTCAEAGAIAAMVAGSTERPPVIDEIVTVTSGSTPGTACGGCRQRIREFSDASTVIRAMNVGGAETTMSIEELLPDSFGPERLR
jgi:cytidine deaminase